jgi:hypothetical protein
MVVALVAAGFIGYKYAVRYKWLPPDPSSAQVLPAEISNPMANQGVQTTDVKKPAPVLPESAVVKEDAGNSPKPTLATPPTSDLKVAGGPTTLANDSAAVPVQAPTEAVAVQTPVSPPVAAVAPMVPNPAVAPPSAAQAPTRIDSTVATGPALAAAPVTPAGRAVPKRKSAEASPRKTAHSTSSSTQDDTWEGASRIF